MALLFEMVGVFHSKTGRNWGRSPWFGATLVAALLALGSTAQAEDDSSTAGPKRLTPRAPRATAPVSLEQLDDQIKTAWSAPTLQPGTTAIYVVDAHTGVELFEVHGDEAMNPASNVKLVSTATVLDTLGSDWRFRTHLIGAEPSADGVLPGDVFLHGNYDPTLGPGAIGSLAAQLAERGVTRLEGNIHLDGSDSKDTIAARRIRFTVRGLRNQRRPQVETWPKAAHVDVDSSQLRTVKKGRSWVKAQRETVVDDEGNERIRVRLTGRVRAGVKRVTFTPIRNAPYFTGQVLKQALNDAGIEALGAVHSQSNFASFQEAQSRRALFSAPLAIHDSPTMASLVARVNKRSLNHLADRLVMSAARSQSGAALAMSDAVELMNGWLDREGLNTDSTFLDTGSGLSYQSRLSARQIVGVLRRAAGYDAEDTLDEPTASQRAFRDSLSVAKVDGTLRKRFRLPGHTIALPLRGKTGTLTGVIALSGFIEHPSGRTLCFSILSNGHPKHYKRSVRLAHEDIIDKVDEFLNKATDRSYATLLQTLEAKERRARTEMAQARDAALNVMLGSAAPTALP